MRQLDIAANERVVDVACGTGNAAIPAAAAGARVTGVDLAPEMLQIARACTEEAGVAVDWVEGDAEALPLPDGHADVVVSTFGCMFAPRHEVVADELARVLAPGGRLGLCAWTPDGSSRPARSPRPTAAGPTYALSSPSCSPGRPTTTAAWSCPLSTS